MQLHCINTLLCKGQKIQVILSEKKKRKSLNRGDNLLDDSSGSLRKVSPLHGIQSAIYSTVVNHADYRNFTVTRSASMGVFLQPLQRNIRPQLSVRASATSCSWNSQ